ncbi:hypothetical protein C5S31_11615 [ANME-1 cluster archaeon GoMg2]|nr:hypothetical protein [ANME-1 cluster archaeon GoMg2]
MEKFMDSQSMTLSRTAHAKDLKFYMIFNLDKNMNKKKEVEFTLHTEDKLGRLTKIGVTKEKILEII